MAGKPNADITDKEGKWGSPCWQSMTKGGEGVWQLLKISENGGRGASESIPPKYGWHNLWKILCCIEEYKYYFKYYSFTFINHVWMGFFLCKTIQCSHAFLNLQHLYILLNYNTLTFRLLLLHNNRECTLYTVQYNVQCTIQCTVHCTSHSALI